jgi:hypothetical protein
MKKILTALMLLFALCMAASATNLMPSWVENMSPGQSYTYGEYSASKGFAEGAFTPTEFRSGLMFGDGVTGARIFQDLETSITGAQVGSVDRQLMGQSASAYAAYNDPNDYWDPEVPSTWLVAQMGMTKNQFAAFSGALTGDVYLDKGLDANGDGFPDDHYTGQHEVQWVAVDDPSWTTTYSDCGTVYSPSAELKQKVEDATVTISADVTVSPDDLIQHIDANCDGSNGAGSGLNEIWEGFGDPSKSPNFPPTVNSASYAGQKFIASDGDLLDFVTINNAQLTEMSSTMDSDVSLTQIRTNNMNGPVTTTTLAGSSSLGGQFQNAFLDPGVKLSVDINTGAVPFQYWWEQPA